MQSGGGGLFFPGHNKGSARKSWGLGALAAGGPTFDGHWQTSTEITLLHRDLLSKSLHLLSDGKRQEMF